MPPPPVLVPGGPAVAPPFEPRVPAMEAPLALQSPVFANLPAPCVQAHAANLAPLRDGSIGCVWFGGSMEGRADIGVWFSRYVPGATGWSEPQPLSSDPQRSEQNPILFYAPSGALWLLHTAQFSGHQNTATVRRRISTNHGQSWGEVHTLFDSPGTFVRQPPVVAADGSVLVPVFRCRSAPGQAWDGSLDDSAVMRSTDGGTTWTTVPVPGSVGCVHMSIVPGGPQVPGAHPPTKLQAGRSSLLAFFRSRWADHIYVSHSGDDGCSWSTPQPTALPNNNSSIQALRLQDGRLAMIFNASSALNATERREGLYDEIEAHEAATAASAAQGASEPAASQGAGLAPPADLAPPRRAFWGAPRAPLTVALSADNGRTWPWQKHLQEGDGYCISNNSAQQLNRELSYPSLVQAPDGTLHAAYTHFRQHIRHVRFTAEWVAS